MRYQCEAKITLCEHSVLHEMHTTQMRKSLSVRMSKKRAYCKSYI